MGANQATSETRIANTKRTQKKVLEALKQSMGVVSHACAAAKISRNTFYEWYNEDVNFKQAVIDIKESNKDFAEAMILKKIKDGDTTMIIFYAKTQMKDRGYVERQEFTGENGSAFNLGGLSDSERDLLVNIGEKVLNDK